MRKLVTISIVLFLFNVAAGAQWYLFPGARASQEEQTETLREEQNSRRNITPAPAPRHDEYDEEGFKAPFFGSSTVRLTLALPINAGSNNPSANFLEMYCGALLALNDLGNEGIKVRLKLVDTGSGHGLSASDIEDSDVIIGPVSYDEMLDVLPLCKDQKMLVSPLDPKTAALAESSSVIQAPSAWTSQIDELADWVQEDLMPGDELIVIRDPSSGGQGEQSNYLINRLHGKVLNFRIVKSAKDISFREGTTYRILIASDSDSFMTGATRAVAIEAAQGRNIILYSTSRIRSTIGSNVNDLHNTRTRLTAAYYIDYDSPKVKEFILDYRALFKAEPGSFAFQGYDIVHYFVNMCADYGKKWYRRLPEYQENGLQSDFRFDRRETGGRMNVAVRRIVYNADLTTTLVQD